MLSIENLSKTYPNGAHALERFSLNVDRGEIVAVIGGSGCGKSTLLRLIAGLETASQGSVTVAGQPIRAPHPLVNLIFQEPRLLPWLTVAENVGFGLADAEIDARRELIESGLRRVGLSDYANRWPKELSGGQAQRVAIARALVTRPQVLLLDEPFSALDAFTRADLQDHLLEIWATARPTMLLVTHDIDEALVLADRVVVMQPWPGRILRTIDIGLPRRRDRGSEEFAAARHDLLLVLNDSLRHRPAYARTA